MLLLEPYIKHLVTALLGGFFLALGIFSFGEPLLFDRLFFSLLFLIVYAFRKDINLLGIISIIIVERLSEEIAFLLVLDNWILKLATYGLAFYVLKMRMKDSLFIPVSVCLLMTIGAELYWLFTDYKFLNTHWYAFLISLNLLVRKAISSRVFLTIEHFDVSGDCTPLKVDFYIYQLAGVFAIINMFMLAEYGVRHLLSIDLLFVYTYYSMVTQALAFVLLFVIADQSIKVTRSRLIQA